MLCQKFQVKIWKDASVQRILEYLVEWDDNHPENSKATLLKQRSLFFAKRLALQMHTWYDFDQDQKILGTRLDCDLGCIECREMKEDDFTFRNPLSSSAF